MRLISVDSVKHGAGTEQLPSKSYGINPFFGRDKR